MSHAPEQAAPAAAIPGPPAGPAAAGVIVLGLLIAVPALLGLLGSISLSFGSATAGSAFAGMIDLGYVALGVGLILRRERARRIYVGLAVIGLVLLAVLFAADVAAHTGGNGEERSSTEAVYARRLADPNETAQGRRAIAAEEQAELARIAARSSEGPTPGRYLPPLLLTLVPLVFLTRPGVRRVFS